MLNYNFHTHNSNDIVNELIKFLQLEVIKAYHTTLFTDFTIITLQL